MTYIKQNVNFILTFVALALALLVAGSTVFFNTNLQKTASDLSQTEKEIDNLKGNLNLEIAKITDVEEDLSLQEKRETDLSEQYMGTDYQDGCPDDTKDAAWPPDFDNSRKVNLVDINLLKQYYDTKKGDGKYLPRYDLNTDGAINLMDVLVAKKYYDKECNDYKLSAVPSGSWVTFSWTSGVYAESRILISDKNKHNGVCSLPNSPDESSLILSSGQTSWVWAGSSKIIAGHNYCAAIFGFSGSISSNLVEFTVPPQ